MRPSALPRANILATLPTMAIAGAPVVALSFASGGGYPTAWNLLTISMVAAGAAVAYVRRPPLGRYELAAIGLLGALTSYSALSYAWSADPPATAAEAQRWLALTATLACLALAARSGGHRAVGAGVAGAAMVVCSYALATRLLPDLLATPHASSVNRLYEPIGYWNGLGELAAVGVVLSLGLAAQASVPGRMVAAAGIVPLSATLYLTFSRGAVLAVIVGVIVAAALEVNRLEWIVRALVLAPAGLASVVVLHSFPALTTAFPPHAAEVRQGALALVTLGLVVVASVAVAYRWAAVSNRCLRSDRARRNAVRGMLITAVLAGVLVVAAAGGPKTFVHALGTSGESAPHFKHGDLNLRLLSLSPNGRSEIWRVAWHDLRAHPVLGSGDGSFAQRWLAARTEDLPTVAAHSLYLETAAELRHRRPPLPDHVPGAPVGRCPTGSGSADGTCAGRGFRGSTGTAGVRLDMGRDRSHGRGPGMHGRVARGGGSTQRIKRRARWAGLGGGRCPGPGVSSDRAGRKRAALARLRRRECGRLRRRAPARHPGRPTGTLGVVPVADRQLRGRQTGEHGSGTC